LKERLYHFNIEAIEENFSPFFPMNNNKSGLQKQVLSLYRKLLRNSYAKDRNNDFYSLLNALSDVNSTTFALRGEYEKFVLC